MSYVAINPKQQLLQIRAAEGSDEWTKVVLNAANNLSI